MQTHLRAGGTGLGASAVAIFHVVPQTGQTRGELILSWKNENWVFPSDIERGEGKRNKGGEQMEAECHGVRKKSPKNFNCALQGYLAHAM